MDHSWRYIKTMFMSNHFVLWSLVDICKCLFTRSDCGCELRKKLLQNGPLSCCDGLTVTVDVRRSSCNQLVLYPFVWQVSVTFIIVDPIVVADAPCERALSHNVYRYVNAGGKYFLALKLPIESVVYRASPLVWIDPRHSDRSASLFEITDVTNVK